MTKEELEKEARFCTKGWKEQENCVQAYLASAEPREKQIQIDAEQIRALQKQNVELTDKVKELEEKNIELENKLCNVANNLLENWCRNKEDYCPHLEKLEAQIEQMKCCGS